MSIKGEGVQLDLEMENEILRLRVKELERQMGSPQSKTSPRSNRSRSVHEEETVLPDVRDMEEGRIKNRQGVILSDSSKVVLLKANSFRSKSTSLPTGTLLKAATMTGHLRPEHNREFFMGLAEAPRKGSRNGRRSAPGGEGEAGKDWIEPHDHRIRFAKHNKGPLSFQKAQEEMKERGLQVGVKTPRSRLTLPHHSTNDPQAAADAQKPREGALMRRQRKAIAAVRLGLSQRFDSVYEAFAFLDASGDWQVSLTDAVIGLRKLKMDREVNADTQSLAVEALDRLNNRQVCPRLFVKLLTWHPEYEDWHAGLEEARSRRRHIVERVELEILGPESAPLYVFHKPNKSSSKPSTASREGERGEREETPHKEEEKAKARPPAVTISEKKKKRREGGEGGSGSSGGGSGDEQWEEEDEEDEEEDDEFEDGGAGEGGGKKSGKDWVDMDLPTLGGRVLDLQDQEMLAAIEEARAEKKKMHEEGGAAGMSTSVTVRGRRLDDNVTLPMNSFSLNKTKWLLTIYDFLCVRLDPAGKRTSKIGEGKVCEGVMVPETLVYRQHTISQWYYVDAANKIARKTHTKEFTAPNIQASFCKPDRVHQGEARAADSIMPDDPVAYFVELSEHTKDDGSDYLVKWLDQKGLDAFLRSHQKPRSGLLQRFVSPVGLRNQLIRVSWTPHHQVVETGSNVHGWQDVSVDLPKRLSTFEASHDLCERGSLSHFRAKDVLNVVDKITSHVNALLPSGCSCWSGIFYLKLNPNSELLFLWCSDLQVRNYYEVEPGFVPRPYNHVDERPTQPYASEKDRRQRIERVKNNPRDIAAWKALTRYDRKVLRVLHDDLVALEERGGFPSGDPAGRLGNDEDEDGQQEEEEEEEVQRKLTVQVEEKSELPKTKRRHLDKYFMSLGPEKEGSRESTADITGQVSGEVSMRPALKSRQSIGPSLSEVFRKTRQWAPHRQAPHPPRSSTPRLRAPVHGRAEAWEGNVETFLCPMPSAVCQQRHQLQPARTSVVTYKQCLAILGADKADVLDYILSAGDGRRLGPEKFCAPQQERIESPASPDPRDTSRDGVRPNASLNESSANSLGLSQRTKGGKKTTVLSWEKSRDDLIMRTLLQAQQGTLKGVSIQEMVEDHNFLRREVEVCERCALLVNKWAQFDQDPEERTKAKVAAILKYQA